MGSGGLGTHALTLTEGRPLPACWWGPQKGHPSCPGLQCARWKMEKKIGEGGEGLGEGIHSSNRSQERLFSPFPRDLERSH